MTDEIVLYTNPQSRGAMTHWMLEEIGCRYRIEVLTFATTMKTPQYLALNPMGKVPTITHGDTVVTETGAILCYLADAFPEAGLAPAVGKRGAYYRWLFFVAGCGEPAMTGKAAGWDPDTVALQARCGYGSFERTMETIATTVEGKRFIAADHFTAADLYMASFLNWGMLFGMIDKRPVFDAYVTPHIGRPAARRAREQVERLMAKAG